VVIIVVEITVVNIAVVENAVAMIAAFKVTSALKWSQNLFCQILVTF